jgi:protein-tyrosine phosphatase
MNPTEITWITDQIAITNYVTAQRANLLAEQHIKAILCLDRELEGGSLAERGIACLRVVHLTDGANRLCDFIEAIATLEELVRSYDRVVVHYRAGRSRSIAVVAAYLKKARQMEVDEALQFVTSKREAAVAPELIELVERYEL